MRYTLHVTQDRIDRGKPGNCGECPIALTFIDEFPGREVEVVGPVVFIERYAYTLPEECLDFIGRYDNQLPVAPFSFSFDMTAVDREWRKLL